MIGRLEINLQNFESEESKTAYIYNAYKKMRSAKNSVLFQSGVHSRVYTETSIKKLINSNEDD
jgi:hypothetical protein